VQDSSFLLLFNASADDARFTVPSRRFGRQWALVVDTADPDAEAGSRSYASGAPLDVTSRSLVLLRRAY
jgi:isoamylase